MGTKREVVELDLPGQDGRGLDGMLTMAKMREGLHHTIIEDLWDKE